MSSKIDALKKDFSNILERWEKALDQPRNDITRDSAILRFFRQPADEVVGNY